MAELSRVRVRVGSCAEDRTVQDNVGDIVQRVGLDFNQVRLAKEDDFGGVARVASGILQIHDLGDSPGKVDVRHGFTHQTRRDTKTTDLGLELPVDDLILQGRDEEPSALVLDFGPADEWRGSLATKQLLLDWRLVQIVGRLAEGAEDGEVASVRLVLDTILVVIIDAVECPHEDQGGEGTRDERDGEEESIDDTPTIAWPLGFKDKSR